jgi:hypothetical protein
MSLQSRKAQIKVAVAHDIAARERHVSPPRVALVALGLVPLGALAGAIAGALGVTIWLSVAEGLGSALDPLAWGMAGSVGAALGAVLLPIAGLTVLRYVPLGRALGETILGTAVGGALGVQFLGGWWLAGPLVGFGLAAIRLWALARRARMGSVAPR